MRLSDGAQISSTTSSDSNGGNISITAQDIELRGATNELTGLLAAVNEGASGNGGNLVIDARTLEVIDAAQVVVGTLGDGDGGTLVVNVEQIRLAGADEMGRSGLFASAILGTGEGGNIQVRGDRLIVEDGATISASNFPSSGDSSEAGQVQPEILPLMLEISNCPMLEQLLLQRQRGDGEMLVSSLIA
ncbi:MAG: hypothetical protein F6K09_30755 [Merismopedia sp. SIO2A8]|nr:hypothetical protein [Merismopedia sp. SIO2A8]